MQNFYKIFLAITVISIVLLGYIYYQNNNFKTKPLSYEIKYKLKQKEYRLKKLVLQKYHKKVDIPIIISSKMPNKLFGLASCDENGNIKIYLNKKRFQESTSYMIDYVLPHEYAHALMFVFNKFPKQNGGHTKLWQDICLSLKGKKCDRFVKHNDILMGKLEFLH